jgi:hypothetical protein
MPATVLFAIRLPQSQRMSLGAADPSGWGSELGQGFLGTKRGLFIGSNFIPAKQEAEALSVDCDAN